MVVGMAMVFGAGGSAGDMDIQGKIGVVVPPVVVLLHSSSPVYH